MGFEDFLGNEAVVRRLRESIRTGRLPHSLVLSGPRGSGKYTLALMLAQAANCLEQPESNGLPNFCGVCSNCSRIAQALPLDQRIDEAVAARDELRETDKKETRVLIQTHPDVLVIPPDPPQLLIKLGQVRSLVREIYRMPLEARRSVFILTSSALVKEAANSLLKVFEEPPDHASIILLAENPGELMPTIRSRAQMVRLGALPVTEIEALLAVQRSKWSPADSALVARLSDGAVGRALSFNLDEYRAGRRDALLLLRSSQNEQAEPDHSSLFRMTETYRAGAEGQQKTSALLRSLTTLLEDLLLIHAGQAAMVRNVDIERELRQMAQTVTFNWIESAARGITQVESGMRRNLLRSLALDSFAASLSGTEPAA